MPIKVEAIGLTALVTKLDRASKNTNKGIGRAVGAARRIAPAEATKAARGAYNVKRNRIAKEWKTTAPNLATLSFDLIGLRKPISILQYGFRSTARKGISAQVMQGGKRQQFRRGFVAKSVPFQRVGKERLPIKPIFGPSMADMLANPRVLQPVSRAFVDRMTKEMFRLIESAFNRG